MGNAPVFVNHSLLTAIESSAAFSLTLSVWLIGVVLYFARRSRRDQQLKRRLESTDNFGPGEGSRVLRLWHEGKEITTVVPGMGGARSSTRRIDRLLSDAGVETPVSTFLLGLSVSLLTVVMVTFMITGSTVIGLCAAAGVLIVVWLVLSKRASKRVSRFERQLIDALELASRSLRVGHPLVGAFRLISEEVPEPIGDIFGHICQQEALGVAVDDALRAVSAETRSEDMKLFATSVVIQLRTGGNLADLMERLAEVIRERSRLARRVRVITAQTQFSKQVLMALPFLVFFAMNVLNPKYVQMLYVTQAGQVLLVIASVLMILGWFTMNLLSRIDT